MRKFTAKNHYEGVLKANIWFCIGKQEDLVKFWERKLKKTLDLDFLNGADGSVFWFDGDPAYRVLWLEDFKKDVYHFGLLAHEISHLVMRIFKDKGIPIEIENEEVFAYYTDYITRAFYKTIK